MTRDPSNDQQILSKDHSIEKLEEGNPPIFEGLNECVPDDTIDLEVNKCIKKAPLMIPIVRVTKGTYLIGTRKSRVEMRFSSCTVRVGGGYQSFDVFLPSIEKAEFGKLVKLIRSYQEDGKTYSHLFRDLIKKCGGDPRDFQAIEEKTTA